MSGSSGVGKNTVINDLVKKDNKVKTIVSYTTRGEIRPGEVDGINYHFITKEKFEELIASNDIMEYDLVHGQYYGHGIKVIEKDFETHDVAIADLSYRGVEKSKEVIGDRYPVVTIFLTESKKELKKRLIARGEQNIKRRLSIYKDEQKQAPNFDYIIKNEVVEDTTEIIQAIIKQEQKQQLLLPTKSCQTISDAKIRKWETKLEKGKKVPPVVIAQQDGKLYIVEGRHRYLASLKTGIALAKIVDQQKKIDLLSKEELAEWGKIVKSFKV